MLDWRGTPIEPGCLIVYPGRHSSSMWMMEAEVLEITSAPNPYDFTWSQDKVALRVQPLRQGRYDRVNKKPVKLTALERVTVIRGPLRRSDIKERFAKEVVK
jgi:hypothetical protein